MTLQSRQGSIAGGRLSSTHLPDLQTMSSSQLVSPPTSASGAGPPNPFSKGGSGSLNRRATVGNQPPLPRGASLKVRAAGGSMDGGQSVVGTIPPPPAVGVFGSAEGGRAAAAAANADDGDAAQRVEAAAAGPGISAFVSDGKEQPTAWQASSTASANTIVFTQTVVASSSVPSLEAMASTGAASSTAAASTGAGGGLPSPLGSVGGGPGSPVMRRSSVGHEAHGSAQGAFGAGGGGATCESERS